MKKILLSLCLLISVVCNSQQFYAAQQANDDYDAFQLISAASLTATIDRDAVNILTKGFKVYGLWTKYNAIYPMIGGTSTTCKFNLKDPRDLDAAFRLVFTASPTFSSSGVDWNGTTQYANTFLIPNTSLSLNSTTLQYYSTENISVAGYEWGCRGSATNTRIELIIKHTNTNSYSSHQNLEASFGNVVSDSRGLFTGTRTASNATDLYKNTTSIATSSTASVALSTVALFIGASNDNGTAASFSSRNCAGASIGSGLTAAEVTLSYNVWQAFQTKLGRQQ